MSILGHLGNYNTSSTRTHVRFQFSTHAAAGANVAPSTAFEAADIRIYRAAESAAFSATQRSSANGITMTSPFDTLTGVHDVDIDLTDNTDAGFYASGYLYSVVLAPDETIDSQTITGIVLCTFEIGVPAVNVTQFGGTAGTFSGGRPEVNTTHISGSATAADNAEIVFATDFATNYDTTNDAWNVNVDFARDSASAAVGLTAIGEKYASDGYIFTQFRGFNLYNQSVGPTGNTTTTFHLNNATYGDDELNDYLLTWQMNDGDIEWHSRWIDDWNGTTKIATVSPALPSIPAEGDSVFIFAVRRNAMGLSSTAISSVQSGLATSAAQMTAQTDLTAVLADTNELQTDWANGGRLDMLIDGVKAKTDSLAFTVAGSVDANALQFAGQTITAAAGVTIPSTIASPTNITSASGIAVASLGNNVITTASINDGAITSAKFTVSAISGVASGILEKIDQIWRRFFKKATKSATEIKTYADDGTTVVTTQTISSSGSDQTQGAAS